MVGGVAGADVVKCLRYWLLSNSNRYLGWPVSHQIHVLIPLLLHLLYPHPHIRLLRCLLYKSLEHVSKRHQAPVVIVIQPGFYQEAVMGLELVVFRYVVDYKGFGEVGA